MNSCASDAAEARYPDLRGQLTVEPGPTYRHEGRNYRTTFGPARLTIGKKAVLIPAGTPLFGGCDRLGASFNIGDTKFKHTRCVGQVGLADDGRTAEWVEVFGADGTSSSVFKITAQIRSVDRSSITLDGGAVVLGEDARVNCYRKVRSFLHSGLLVELELDKTASLTQATCLYTY